MTDISVAPVLQLEGDASDIMAGMSFAGSMLSKKRHVPLPSVAPSVLEYERPFRDREIITSDGHVIQLKPKQRFGDLRVEPEEFKDDSCGIDIGELMDKIQYNESIKMARLQELLENSEHDSLRRKPSSNNVLWAEKWRPKLFMDLVGNERTNRYVLRWIRRWSKCVFGEQVITERQYNNNNNQFPQFKDPFDRPEKRVLLIHGPPGIGKTTVAHVIARQAGYEVMEVNASDERAGQRVKDKIINSLNTQTFSGKPIVLICDEVDGSAESGFIKVLLDLIQNDARATTKIVNKRDGVPEYKNKRGGNNKANSKLLMRPIICICNDLYAHALEKLRPHSDIVSFRNSSQKAVQERLRKICDKEHVTIDSKELSDIVQLTNCDIRSCLNLLQFSGGESGGELRRKDSQINWFVIVKDIFKREPKLMKKDQYNELSKMVSANNHNDRVVNGLFQLYHDVEYQDDLMYKPNEISDWLFFSDYLGKASFDLQNGELGSYCSQVPLKFFLSFSDPNNNHEKKLRPQSDYEHYEMRRSNIELLKRFMSNIDITSRSSLIFSNLSTQLVPFIELLLAPEIKSPRFNLKPNDKRKIEDALAVLTSYGISLQQRREESLMRQLTLYPPIDQITKFENFSRSSSNLKILAAYPILLQELEAVKHLKRKLLEDELLLESKINKKAKNAEVPEKKFTSTMDFFKSQYEDISNATNVKTNVRDEESRIWIKYHEGFSNAVRKNISWDDLWNF